MDVIYHVAMSLDGFIATSDGGVEWLEPFQGKVEDYGFAAFMESIDAVIMGRHTYDVARGFGAWFMTDVPSFVLSSSRNVVPVHDSITVTPQSPQEIVEQLSDRGYKRVWMMGGANLATSMLAAGLLTHFKFAVIPVILGDGIPLFAPGADIASVSLEQTTKFDDGVVVLDYRV